LAPAALLAFALGACRSDELPDLDVNGIWSLNWMASRYTNPLELSGGLDDDWHVDYVIYDTLIFEIEGLRSSGEGGRWVKAWIGTVYHQCQVGWSDGDSSTVEGPIRWGGDLRWSPDYGNTLLHDVGWDDEEQQRPMHCTFPTPDQMRCAWGRPYEPVNRVEERDEVLVFDRGDAALSPLPCERVAERAILGPPW
jgi:hypothetical protein